MKKLASLLLSLLLCLSLLPGQAAAANAPEGGLPVQMEASEMGQPDDPDEAAILSAAEFPEKDTTEKTDS